MNSAVRGARISPTSRSLAGDDAAHGGADHGVVHGLVEHGNLGVDGRHPCPRGRNFLPSRARLQARDPFASRLEVLLGGPYALASHVAPRRGVVSLLLRSGIRFEERVEALQVHVGRAELGLRRLELGFSGRNLGPGLPHVLRSRAGQQQLELGLGLRPLGDGRGLAQARCRAGRAWRPRRRDSPDHLRPPSARARGRQPRQPPALPWLRPGPMHGRRWW